MNYVAHALLMLVPFAALAVAGVLIAWRYRTVLTALVALGFCSVALSHILSEFVGFYVFEGLGGFAANGARFGWTLTVVHWGMAGGAMGGVVESDVAYVDAGTAAAHVICESVRLPKPDRKKKQKKS